MVKEGIYKCEICGKSFTRGNGWTSFRMCSEACQRKHRNEYARKYKGKQAAKKNARKKGIGINQGLEDANKKALEMGLTYGQYMALKYCERDTKERQKPLEYRGKGKREGRK